MESKRITAALACVLAAACLIVTVILVSVNRKINYLPNSSVNDIVSVLEKNNIIVSPDIIETKRVRGDVFVFDSDEYSETVVRALGGQDSFERFATPTGEIFLLENGQLFEFGKDFYFRYSGDGKKYEFPTEGTLIYPSAYVSSETDKIIDAAVKFLDSGSRRFAKNEKISIVTSVDMIYESDGLYYSVCTRMIDGIPITGNTVTCAYSGEEIIGADGAWCFFTEAESHSAQLTDHLNILFNAGKDISHEENEKTEIMSITMCYSIYYYGDGEGFCLIPCWQVTTDTQEKLVYNALDGTLCTNK